MFAMYVKKKWKKYSQERRVSEQSVIYDIFISFAFNGDNWNYSLYSKTIDVSEIAKVREQAYYKMVINAEFIRLRGTGK